MELKTYTPVGLKFVFEKIKFKVLHYIRQRPGLSKDQINMFKSLVIEPCYPQISSHITSSHTSHKLLFYN